MQARARGAPCPGPFSSLCNLCLVLTWHPLLRPFPAPPPAAAGYETTANALSFAIYCLSTTPEAEARVLAEVDAFGADKVRNGAHVWRSSLHAWRLNPSTGA